MLQIQKPAGAETWAGVTIAQEFAGSDLTADGNVACDDGGECAGCWCIDAEA